MRYPIAIEKAICKPQTHTVSLDKVSSEHKEGNALSHLAAELSSRLHFLN